MNKEKTIPNFCLQAGFPEQQKCPFCLTIMPKQKSKTNVISVRCEKAGCKKIAVTAKNKKPIMLKYDVADDFLIMWHGNTVLSIGKSNSDFSAKMLCAETCNDPVGSDAWHKVINKVGSESIKRIETLKIFK